MNQLFTPAICLDYPKDSGLLRLIGLELRLADPFGMTEEVELIPLNWEIRACANATRQWRFGNHTLHTSVGDVNIPPVTLPYSGFGLRMR